MTGSWEEEITWAADVELYSDMGMVPERVQKHDLEERFHL